MSKWDKLDDDYEGRMRHKEEGVRVSRGVLCDLAVRLAKLKLMARSVRLGSMGAPVLR